MTRYKQCILQKGNRFKHAWIPIKYAKSDRFLKINKSDGWEVIKVFNFTVEEYQMKMLKTQSRTCRRETDI